MSKDHQIITTADGSSSIYLPELDETYHSKHGAVQESMHVFVREGLEYVGSDQTLKLLEVGMGTGLNVLLSWDWAERNDCSITMKTLEPFPIPSDVARQLDFGGSPDWTEKLEAIHAAKWGEACRLSENFSLEKHKSKLLHFDDSESFDLVFYDAFGPKAQAEMWNEKHAAVLSQLTAAKGVLTTYCSQGQFRRNLMAVGFEVEKIAGPPGKWEMIRATKQ